MSFSGSFSGFWVCLILSLILVAFGQPAWVSGLGIAAGCIGFALFWRAMLFFPKARDRFWLSVLWFGVVQGIQLSWMTSIHYMGSIFLLVYLFVLAALGIQFGLLSLFLKPGEKIGWLQSFSMAGCWVLLEWVRIHFLTGFTWNPVGLSLTDSSFSLQWAALWGIYGLSFWVVFVNLLGLNAFFLEKTRRNVILWAALALVPYGFGGIHKKWVELTALPSKTLSVALVQTGLMPEQKDYFKSRPEAFIPALDQWERIFGLLKKNTAADLIVLPEAAIPFGAHKNIYPLPLVRHFWKESFGEQALTDLPPLQKPFAVSHSEKEEHRWKVNNAFIAQGLANHFNANVIVGFDDYELESDLKYNAAFHFKPQGLKAERVEKRILVPVVEYIPLLIKKSGVLSKFLNDEYGINDSFDSGRDAKIFQASLPIGVSICIEEIYPHLIRELRQKGAELFVNISNDGYFPASRLPSQHYHHGRVRAVENGVYSVRACNTGVTGGVDCFGSPMSCLPVSDATADILYLSFPVKSYKTIYTFWGDSAILIISLSSLIGFFFSRRGQGKKERERKSCPK